MFRCKECGCEYKEKPDYCDCGNNTFDEILPSKASINLPDIKQLVSVLIFILCLILAIIPWTIHDKSQPQQTPKVKKVLPKANIPDIEEIWNNQAPQSKPKTTPAKQISTKTELKTTATKPVTRQNAPVKQPSKIQPKKSTPTKIQKSKTQQTTKTNTVKKSQAAKPKSSPKTGTSQTKPPKVVEKVAQQVSTNTPPQTTIKKQQSTVQKPKPVDKTPLINYKNELRIALLAKLNVPNVTGSGDCAVSFSIDTATGKLLNRNFIYKSNNKSVNDEVYYMLMRLPYFKKPPSIYKGETIKLKFYFNNGYYEISFI